jgi:uncharacterized SAM-binding protein YcdF (DUF218 family)
MRNLLSMLIMPVPFLYILLTAGLVSYLFRRKRTMKFFLISAGIWFLVITTLPVPQLLVRSLENNYHQLADDEIKRLPGSCNIIVLGAGHTDDKALSPNNQLSNMALGRLVEGIRIHRMIPGSRLILSGYAGKSDLPQALVFYRTALSLGVDSAAMAMLSETITTRMEAEEYVRYFGKEKKLVIVTNALHMPRAMMHFRNAGLDPVPAPANQILKYGSVKNPWRWIPSSGNIRRMDEVIHEYAGMVWAWVGGK